KWPSGKIARLASMTRAFHCSTDSRRLAESETGVPATRNSTGNWISTLINQPCGPESIAQSGARLHKQVKVSTLPVTPQQLGTQHQSLDPSVQPFDPILIAREKVKCAIASLLPWWEKVAGRKPRRMRGLHPRRKTPHASRI